MSTCRILIISEHPLFAEGVERLINGRAGLHVVGVVSSDEALASISALSPDVVIVDADRAAQAAFSQMLRENPGTKFIGLTLDSNDINVYYQRNKKSTGVEALVEAIREPLEWKLPERPRLRLLIITQGAYGQRMAENIRLHAPEHWTVQEWALPSVLPDRIEHPRDWLPPLLPASDLILSLGQSAGVAQLLPEIVQMTGAQGVIAPIDDETWMPADQVNQVCAALERLKVTCVFPQPFCSLTEVRYNVQGREAAIRNGPIREFASYFGQPSIKISVDTDAHVLCETKVLRDSPCGCARYVAEKLIGVSVDEAETQVEAFHHSFPCMAGTTTDSDYGDTLLNVSSRILQNALRGQLRSFQALPGSTQLKVQFE